MSDYETPASGSLYDQLQAPDPTAYPAEFAAEDEFEEAAQSVRDARDATRAEDDWRSYVDANALDLDGQGYDLDADPELREALVGEEAERYWAERSAREEYQQHVTQVAAERDAEAEADSIVRQAAERHNLPQSLEDGSLRAISDWVWSQASKEAFDNGDEERYAALHTQAGVRAAVDLAAQIALQERAREWAWKGNGPDLSTEKGRRDRAEWVAHAARRGIPGAPLWREETTP